LPGVPGQKGRHTREPYADWDLDLIYVTDGDGGGLTVLRYTGVLPARPPIPGVRSAGTTGRTQS